MTFEVIFFDLDDTLYDSSNGLWEAIRQRMETYMIERLHIPAEQVPELRSSYLAAYGTTLRGLQAHYAVDADDYLAYVHDFPLQQYLQPAPELRQMLLSLPQRRWIFTNSDNNHVQRVLLELGLQGCFEGVVDIRLTQFVCKPDPLAYQLALKWAGEPRPEACLLIDDSPANLETARSLGMTTVLVNRQGLKHPAADYMLRQLADLPQVLPSLWNSQSRTRSDRQASDAAGREAK